MLGSWDKRMAEGLSACWVLSMVSSNRTIPTRKNIATILLVTVGLPSDD